MLTLGHVRPRLFQILVHILKTKDIRFLIIGKIKVKVAQLCPSLCVPCSPPGSSVHGILLAEILEWVAISFSKGKEIHLQFWGCILRPLTFLLFLVSRARSLG